MDTIVVPQPLSLITFSHLLIQINQHNRQMFIPQLRNIQLVSLAHFTHPVLCYNYVLQGAFEPFKNSNLPHLAIFEHEITFYS